MFNMRFDYLISKYYTYLVNLNSRLLDYAIFAFLVCAKSLCYDSPGCISEAWIVV